MICTCLSHALGYLCVLVCTYQGTQKAHEMLVRSNLKKTDLERIVAVGNIKLRYIYKVEPLIKDFKRGQKVLLTQKHVYKERIFLSNLGKVASRCSVCWM